ncbi:hypothetical protein [Nocardioides sp. URHA0020]|uniref:hypothetical protein n=1 Tax=Nocardioides sp. URHA0020 TaxID=1380392 RepID=UPI000AFFD14B|nr:hypothetical protein [Nocardioides sp. URHA0020]
MTTEPGRRCLVVGVLDPAALTAAEDGDLRAVLGPARRRDRSRRAAPARMVTTVGRTRLRDAALLLHDTGPLREHGLDAAQVPA